MRHPSFFVPAFAELLARHNAALVLADTAGIWPYAEEITADFVYIKLYARYGLIGIQSSDGACGDVTRVDKVVRDVRRGRVD